MLNKTISFFIETKTDPENPLATLAFKYVSILVLRAFLCSIDCAFMVIESLTFCPLIDVPTTRIMARRKIFFIKWTFD